MIRFACPNCSKEFKAKFAFAGKHFRCTRCATRIEVPKPDPGPADIEDVLPVEEEEEIADALPVDQPDEPRRRSEKPRDKPKKKRLVVEGTNGVVELCGTELTIHHDGGSGFTPFDRHVRAGTYRHHVLSVTRIEITQPTIIGGGLIRFYLGHERDDPTRPLPVVDEQTITFSGSQYMAFVRLKQIIERFQVQLREEIRMRQM
jgi:hypothetical protein